MAKTTPMMTFEIPVPDAKSYGLNNYLPPGQTAEQLAAENCQLQKDIDALTKRYDENRALLLAAMELVQAPAVLAGPYKIIKVEGGARHSLNREKLLAAGVTPQQLDAGTNHSKSASYIKVTNTGENND